MLCRARGLPPVRAPGHGVGTVRWIVGPHLAIHTGGGMNPSEQLDRPSSVATIDVRDIRSSPQTFFQHACT
eukprot:COSAG02_NODE_2846_length_7905_cov_14.993378_8_plen_71_part_00